MPVQCTLLENTTTTDAHGRIAMVRISSSRDGHGLAHQIIDQGSTPNRPEILSDTYPKQRRSYLDWKR